MNPWLGVLLFFGWLAAVLLIWGLLAGATKLERDNSTPGRGGTTTEGGDA